MEPLRIVATLRTGIAMPGGPLALDALLMAAVAARDHIPPPDDEVREIPIPVALEPGGRFHLASFALYTVEARENHWINRRFPVEEAQKMGGPRVRRINLSGGPAKSYRLPMEVCHLVDDRM